MHTELPHHPFAFLYAGWRYRSLIRRLTARKIQSHYRGSRLGVLWALFHPLLMLSVYTFVFSVVFQARWDPSDDGDAEFALFVFSGMILYAIFSKCVNEAPTLMAVHQTYIKQVVFPAEVLAWVSLLAALFDFVVGWILLMVFHLVVLGPPPLTAIFLPLVLCPVLLMTLGAVWLLASLGVFLKDVSHVVGVATTALFFLSPIFYPISSVPEPLRPYYALNPFASVLEMSRASLFYGTPPDWPTLGALVGVAWLGAWLGYLWFMKTKGSFADLL